jgi:hypothetical protein
MQRDSGHWRVLLPCVMLIIATLACGGFQLRPTTTPGPAAIIGQKSPTARPAKAAPTPTEQAPVLPTSAPTITPTATIPAGGLAVGQKVRVLATGGVNVRDKASTSGKQVGKLSFNQVVALQDGPVQADNFIWWKVDTGGGLTGWVSSGPANDPWLKPDQGATAAVTPASGGGKLVDRPIKVGDLVQVTTLEGRVLTLRETASKDGNPVARVLQGTQFTVKSGPEQHDDFTWWQVEGEQVKGWAAEGDGTDRWLTPVER